MPDAVADLVDVTDAFFAHPEPEGACSICAARHFGDMAVLLRLTETPPSLVGDLWVAAVAAGLVVDVTSPRFENQLYQAPERARLAPDPDAF